MRIARKPVLCALVVGLLAAGTAAAQGTHWMPLQDPAAAPEPSGPDVVLVEGCDLESTADAAQQRRIRRLLQSGRAATGLAAVTVDYPLDESIFPPEFVPPTFLWHDPTANRWLVDVELDGGASHLYVLVPGLDPPRGRIDPRAVSDTNEIYEPTPYQASARAWKPSAEVWAAIKQHSVDAPARFTFLGYRDVDPERVVSRGTSTLTTSRDPVAATIFYRDVPLMPAPTEKGVIKPLAKGALPLIVWRLRDVSLPSSRVMLTDMPTCANCHSFSADGSTMGMDVDGPSGDKGAYSITPVAKKMVIEDSNVITWTSFSGKPPGHKTLGFLSRVNPDGRYVISTVNEQIYVVNFTNFRFGQVFYPTRGILAYYSTETEEMKALPGADDPEYVHCDPVWMPDGKSIVFARARARDPYVKGQAWPTEAGGPEETKIQYDLYRMPFDEGRGGTPRRIVGASQNGMSNTFPKISPDGKWLVWVQCKNGQLMRPDGRLWIMPVEGGEPREMRCNTRLMNSWHSFSPNGRWMVFSSKSNTPYTQMFLTHIDEQGNDSPAILIENSTAANRAVNLPEFANVAFDDFTAIEVPAVEHYRHFNAGNTLSKQGKHREALVEFELALAEERNDSRIHDSISKSLLQLGEIDRAGDHIRQALQLNPYNADLHANMAYVLAAQGDLEGALRHMNYAVEFNPAHFQAWYNRATLHLQMGDRIQALADYTISIRRNANYAEAYIGRGSILRTEGDLKGAREDFDKAVLLEPNWPTPWYGRALVRKQSGDLTGALEDATRALELAPSGSPQRAEIKALYDELSADLARKGG